MRLSISSWSARSAYFFSPNWPWAPSSTAAPLFCRRRRPLIVRNEDVIESAGIGDRELKAVCNRELAEIERRRRRYLGSRERVDVAGRTAIVVDDSIATGATMRAALRATRMKSKKARARRARRAD